VTRPETAPRADPPDVSAGRLVRPWSAVGRVGPLVAIVGVAVLGCVYFGGGYPNGDTAYAVVWGDQLLGGALPDYGVPSAPTAHPLATAFGMLAALLGESAYDALAVLTYLSFGALVWGVYATGRRCYSRPVGLLGALVVATSYTFLSRTSASYFDVLAVALVLLAALLELNGRRGLPVLAVLGVVGLQRPEAWLLAAGYWLYLVPQVGNRERLRFALLAAAAPAIWTTADLIVTGDPLFSVTGTRPAPAPEGVTQAAMTAPHEEPDSVLSITVDELREILRLPVLLGGAVGVGLALAFLRARSRFPLALLVFGLVSFVGLGWGGLPLVDRFLFLPAAVLAIFFGVAVMGWMERSDQDESIRPRARWLTAVWIAGAVVLLIGLILSMPTQVDRLQGLRDQVRLRVGAVDELQVLAASPRVGALLEDCGRLYLPNEQMRPMVSYVFDRPPRELVPPPPQRPRGAYLEPRAELLAVDAFYLRTEAGHGPPAGAPRVADGRYWTVRARGCAGAPG
jgi:hypothetical protein